MTALSSDIEKLKLKDFDFPLEKIPVLNWKDELPDILQLIRQQKPVLIKDSEISKSALKWNIDYLKQHLGNSKHTVWLSKTNSFKYWSDTMARELQDKISFVPPTKSVNMTISEFASRLENWKRGKEYLYLQQPLNNNVGQSIFDDFKSIAWDKLRLVQDTGSWGELTSNLLLISQKGSVTPVHFDEQENLFNQLVSHKRFLLFPPEALPSLYPYPIFHPHDRQSQVDLDEPDYERFPRLKDLRGFDAVVGPGDVLYVPSSWWHHVETLADNAVSITFWHKCRTPCLEYPLTADKKLTIMRNIEKMVFTTLKDPNDVMPFMETMVLGRYTDFVKK